MSRKNARAKACDITQATKRKVFQRDSGQCVICGSVSGLPNAHIISRAKGGLGTEENVVTLCGILSENQCHHRFDNCGKEDHDRIYAQIKEYMQSKYSDWREGEYVFKGRWAEIDAAAYSKKTAD